MNDVAPFYVQLTPGDPAPWFHQRSPNNPRFAFDSVAGRYIVLCFYGSTGDERGCSAIKEVFARRAFFDDERASFFGVSLDPHDEAENRVANAIPGLRFFWDFDGRISGLYGAVPKNAAPTQGVPSRRFWMVLDPMLRVRKVFPFEDDGSEV